MAVMTTLGFEATLENIVPTISNSHITKNKVIKYFTNTIRKIIPPWGNSIKTTHIIIKNRL